MRQLPRAAIDAISRAAIELGEAADMAAAHANKKTGAWRRSGQGIEYDRWVDELQAVADALTRLRRSPVEARR